MASTKGKLYYASKSTFNDRTVIVGTVPKIIEYLRERPLLQEDLGIVKMFPDGFVTEIVIKGKSTGKTKQFHMADDGTKQAVYVKVGYETMASVKPLDLFVYDCTLGKRLEADRDSRQRASRPGMADNDRSSEAVLKKHVKDDLHFATMSNSAHKAKPSVVPQREQSTIDFEEDRGSSIKKNELYMTSWAAIESMSA